MDRQTAAVDPIDATAPTRLGDEGADRSPAARPPTTLEERYVPGAVIADRYRIVSLLGRGGMGEVYRADDLKLGQAVALKFLPRQLESDPRRLKMLLEEVRVARRVAHPNVCRVYDIGEAAGHHFLTMEYVDGEDLRALLRRIGRLPNDKAAQVARQLCAGLAAAHAEGVLHRDLKPANVMIDGQGRARITDFGLALESEGVTGDQAREGTPDYMAPEQLSGREVTVRSDFYALGLVLYELFTGRRPFEARGLREALIERSSAPTTPSSHHPGLDPAAEAAILRCLEPDADRRPASALAVAAALPGGDPVAAALAAGETPSPEMVADSPAEGRLSPAAAISAVLATVLLLVVGLAVLRVDLHQPGGRPDVVMVDRAREALRALGHSAPLADEDWGYLRDGDIVALLRERPSEMQTLLQRGAPPLYPFWYRTAPRSLLPFGWRAGPDDPPQSMPESALVILDPDGHLVSLAVEPRAEPAPQNAAVDVPWETALAFTGHDPEGLRPAEPVWLPPHYAGERAAWVGEYAGGLPLRIEAGATNGRITWLRSDSPELGRDEIRADSFPALFFVLLYMLFTGILVIGVVRARSNLRSGRADLRGARRLGVFYAALQLASWAAWSSHGLDPREIERTQGGLLLAAFGGLAIATFYLALEPEMRRRWPQRLVSWTRLLDGRLLDPLVGRDLLIGALAGGVMFFGADLLGQIIHRTLATDLLPPVLNAERVGWGATGVVAAWIDACRVGTGLGLGGAVMLLGLTRLLRFEWAAASVFLGIQVFGLSVRDQSMAGAPFATFALLISIAVLFRYGLLAHIAFMTMLHLQIFYPINVDPAVWYSTRSIVVVSLVVVVAAYGAWVSARPMPQMRT